MEKDLFRSKLNFSIFCVETSVLLGFEPFSLKNCLFLKFNHFLFKNAFRINCRLADLFCSKLDFLISCVESRVLLGFTAFCVKNCVLFKFDHFLFKNTFSINCRLRTTFFVLNWIFQYFVLKAEFYWVLHYCVLKTFLYIKFNNFLYKNAFRISCRWRKTFFVLNWIFQYFVLKAEFLWVLYQLLC